MNRSVAVGSHDQSWGKSQGSQSASIFQSYKKVTSNKMRFSSIVFNAIFLIATRLTVVTAYKPDDDDWFILSNHEGGRREDADPDCNDGGNNFCATVENGSCSPGTSVVLDACGGWEPEDGWRTLTAPDGKGFVFVLGTGDYCMQAGEEIVGYHASRSKVRLATCDIKNPLQRFVWKDYKDDDCGSATEGGKIKLQSRKDLCLTWNGADSIETGEVRNVIVMPCVNATGTRAKGWYGR